MDRLNIFKISWLYDMLPSLFFSDSIIKMDMITQAFICFHWNLFFIIILRYPKIFKCYNYILFSVHTNKHDPRIYNKML